jgi:hypothetical protein
MRDEIEKRSCEIAMKRLKLQWRLFMAPYSMPLVDGKLQCFRLGWPSRNDERDLFDEWDGTHARESKVSRYKQTVKPSPQQAHSTGT